MQMPAVGLRLPVRHTFHRGLRSLKGVASVPLNASASVPLVAAWSALSVTPISFPIIMQEVGDCQGEHAPSIRADAARTTGAPLWLLHEAHQLVAAAA